MSSGAAISGGESALEYFDACTFADVAAREDGRAPLWAMTRTKIDWRMETNTPLQTAHPAQRFNSFLEAAGQRSVTVRSAILPLDGLPWRSDNTPADMGAYWFRPGRYAGGGMPRMVRWPR